MSDLLPAPANLAAEPIAARPSGAPFLRVALRNRRTQAGLALLIPLVVLIAAGPALAPYNPNAFVGLQFSAPSSHFWLGTDELGRDVLSRLLVGGWSTLTVSLLGTILGVAAGTAIGLATAIAKGRSSNVAMRLLDAVISFPQYVLVLLFISVFGSPAWLTICLVGAIWAPQVARVIRAAALTVVEQDFIRFSLTLGTSRLRIMFLEVLPSVTAPLSVEFGVRLTYSIALVAGLGFLGFGPPPPAANWGSMITENQAGISIQPWAVLAPVLAIGMLTVAVNLVADGLAQSSARGARR
jgi:peptide/nickel transport system permease protein